MRARAACDAYCADRGKSGRCTERERVGRLLTAAARDWGQKSALVPIRVLSDEVTELAPRDGVADLLGSPGAGPLWGMASADLNATLLAWPPGHCVAEHINDELDVLVIVLEGGGAATVDRREHTLMPGSALLIEKGSARTIRAGPDGIRYLTVHRRRGPLQIATVGENADRPPNDAR